MTPAMVFHASELIACESIARGWLTVWDLVERIGELDAPLAVLGWQIYAVRDPSCRMGHEAAHDLQRILGIDAEIWLRNEALCRDATPEQRATLSDEATAFYCWDDDDDVPDPASCGASPQPERQEP